MVLLYFGIVLLIGVPKLNCLLKSFLNNVSYDCVRAHDESVFSFLRLPSFQCLFGDTVIHYWQNEY